MPRPELFLPRGIPCAKHCSTSEFQLCLPAWFLVATTTRRAKPQPLLTAFPSWLLVFLTWAKHLGFGTTKRATATNQSRFAWRRVLASKVRRPSVWLSENVPNRSGYDSLSGTMEAAVRARQVFLEESLIESFFQTSKDMVKSRDYDSWALKRYETMLREAPGTILDLGDDQVVWLESATSALIIPKSRHANAFK